MNQISNIEQVLQAEGERCRPLGQYILKRLNAESTLLGDGNGRMKELRLMIVRRNALLLHELKQVLKALGSIGIEVIVLKGAMMDGIYPAGLRPFDDIDLLVRRQRLPEIVEQLTALGYSFDTPQLPPRAKDFVSQVHCVKKGLPKVKLDIHFSLGPPDRYSGRVDVEGLWQRAKKSNIEGVEALVLCPEDGLLHCCLHMFEHRQSNWFISSCDIAELVRHYESEINWGAFLQRVSESGTWLPVQYNLKKSYDVFHVPIPLFVIDQLGSHKTSRIEKQVFSLFNKPEGEITEGSLYLAGFLAIPKTTLKLRRIWLLLFPVEEYILSHYAVTNHKLLPLYYVLHLKEALSMALRTFGSYTFKGKSKPRRSNLRSSATAGDCSN